MIIYLNESIIDTSFGFREVCDEKKELFKYKIIRKIKLLKNLKLFLFIAQKFSGRYQ